MSITQLPTEIMYHIIGFLEPEFLSLASKKKRASFLKYVNVEFNNLTFPQATFTNSDYVKYLLSIEQSPNIDYQDFTSKFGLNVSLKMLMDNSVKVGNIECLKKKSISSFFVYAHEKGCSLDRLKICSSVAFHGHLECLRYAHQNGCPWNEWTCSSAARNGNLVCLKYARENGCPWDKTTCSSAAMNGNLVCLKYARENGCPWDKWTCSYAAMYGHLECLKKRASALFFVYAHENGCPWDKTTCSYAARNGHLECLKKRASALFFVYAHENGCPWDKWTCAYATKNGHLEC